MFLLITFSPFSLAAGLGEVFRPYLDYTVVADDNMLRIRDGLDTQAILGTNKLSDISQRFVGGVIFEKEVSRQRLSADVNFGYTKFDRFSQMNNSNRNLRGNWNWVLGNNFSGNLGASNVKSLAPFMFQPGVKNLRVEQTEYFNAAWRFHPSWRLRGDYTRYDLNSDSDIARLRRLSRSEDRFEAGLDYITRNNSSIGVQLRTIRGDFPKSDPALDLAPNGAFYDNSFDQNEVKGKIKWIMTGKSQLQFLGGWVERKNASRSVRDFSGINARLIYNWQPTDKIGLTLHGWRENSIVQNLTASFSLNTGIRAVPTWNLTEKISIEGDFSYVTRKFGPFTDPQIGRNNTFRTVSTSLIYSPYNGIQVSMSAFHHNLTSDSPIGGFSANGANINLRYIFGSQ